MEVALFGYSASCSFDKSHEACVYDLLNLSMMKFFIPI